mgnify:FL=1
MLTVAISKRNKLQNIIVLTPKDGLGNARCICDCKVFSGVYMRLGGCL